MTTIRVVLTGGPGAGKTTVLENLQARGYTVVPEVARQIIADRKLRGLPPRPPAVDFAKAIVAADIEQYSAVTSELTFFDRGIVDALGMLDQSGHLSSEKREALLAEFPYSSPVFVFPPWKTIYRTDSERDQTYEESVQIHASVERWYTLCGYELSTVPYGSVDERCEHILRVVEEQVR